MSPFLLYALALAIAPVLARDSVLVWFDEFDYTGLPDSSRWDYDVGGEGWGNEELQYYTGKRSENAKVENGQLVITARREDTLACWYGNCTFTSARLVSRGKADWLYGRIDVRAKLPSGKGVWPAIWMLSASDKYGEWPGTGEIDIMENVGQEPQEVYGTIHTSAYNHEINTQKGSSILNASLQDSFHVYSLLWSPDTIRIGFDNQFYFSFGNEGTWQTWPFDQPFYLLLNFAVGGWGGQEGIDTALFPQEFRVDWVRVYKVEQGGPFTLNTSVQGSGSVQASPAAASYAALSSVTLTADPADGWEFYGWQDGAAGSQNPKQIWMDHNTNVTALFLPAGERIANGDFSSSLSGWTSWVDDTLAAAIAVTNGEACIKPSHVGSEVWQIQFTWAGIPVLKGEQYDFSAKVHASRARPFQVSLYQDHSPFNAMTSAFSSQASASSAVVSHRFTISANDASARLEWDVGTDTSTICIDSVSLRLVGAVSALVASPLSWSASNAWRWMVGSNGVQLFRNGDTRKYLDLQGRWTPVME